MTSTFARPCALICLDVRIRAGLTALTACTVGIVIHTCTCTCICNLLIIRYSRGTRQALANDKIITRSRIYICELRASGARVASESCNASVNLWVSGTVHVRTRQGKKLSETRYKN